MKILMIGQTGEKALNQLQSHGLRIHMSMNLKTEAGMNRETEMIEMDGMIATNGMNLAVTTVVTGDHPQTKAQTSLTIGKVKIACLSGNQSTSEKVL